MTNISAVDIICISVDDISADGIKGSDKMGDRRENIALTEAVYYILLSLVKPLHGYGIMQNTAQLSGNRVLLAPGTLYGAINALLEKKWIIALPEEQSSRKKEYLITELGKIAVKNEIERLRQLVKNGESILGGETR